MDCWIDVIDKTDHRVVRLAGRLTGAQVPDLLEVCVKAALEVDLTELVSADCVGIDALQRLLSRGATLVGTSPYIQLKLNSQAAALIGVRRLRNGGS